MRIVDQRRMAVNRGATQATIERNTLPHKYKKVCLIGYLTLQPLYV